jgi:hypothetical protein
MIIIKKSNNIMPHLRPHRRKTIAVPRIVRIQAQGKGEGFGLTNRDNTYSFLTLGRINPILQGPQKDARYRVWAVTGLGPRRQGLAPNKADAHLTHISAPI